MELSGFAPATTMNHLKMLGLLCDYLVQFTECEYLFPAWIKMKSVTKGELRPLRAEKDRLLSRTGNQNVK